MFKIIAVVAAIAGGVTYGLYTHTDRCDSGCPLAAVKTSCCDGETDAAPSSCCANKTSTAKAACCDSPCPKCVTACEECCPACPVVCGDCCGASTKAAAAAVAGAAAAVTPTK